MIKKVESFSSPRIQENSGDPAFRPLPPLRREWRSLSHAFVDQARRRWSSTAMADSTGTSLSFGDAFLRALVLGRVLERTISSDPYVGILLPPTVHGAVANLSVGLMGKIAVNLNYTSGQAMIDSAIEQCGIRHVLTSPKVLDRFKVKPRANLILLDDIPKQVRAMDKVWGALVSKLVPQPMLGRFIPGLAKADLDAIATIIFTSGSTGDPKGVVLSQRNVLCNVHQINEQIQLLTDEVLLGILPFFHSFGYTVGIWTALCLGKKVVYHFNPLDSRTVGKLSQDHKVTLIAGTPSFMRFYLKNCEPEQFKTLTHLLLGAEKLKPELFRDIQKTLGIEPMEGYGTTELSPVVAVNVPYEVEMPNGKKVYGNRPGTVGIPVPGTSIKTLDPETGEELPRGKEGLIAVKGPQVMVGYLNKTEATAKVLKDGWYVTGDLGYVDADGFLKITDRLSRFSKIAGEMVPHVGIESAIMDVTGVTEQHVAVTAIPDPRHGERLCVLYTDLGMTPDQVFKLLNAGEMPKLWIPSARDFIRVDAIPLTGTGKVDLKMLREMAQRQPVA